MGAKRKEIPDLRQLFDRYATGENLQVLAREARVSDTTLRGRFTEAGYRELVKRGSSPLRRNRKVVNELVRRYRDERETVPKIVQDMRARDIAITQAMAYQILIQEGVPREHPITQRPGLKERVLRYREGERARRLAFEMGVSRSTFHRWVEEFDSANGSY